MNKLLDTTQIQNFIQRGFVRIDRAFPAQLAEKARQILWTDTGCDPQDVTTWTKPIIRLGYYTDAPFREAANMPRLHSAYNQLVGINRWIAPTGLGTFPVRFPSPVDPGDTGWHIDMGFGMEAPDFLDWRANLYSKGRALLMLFLFSEVGPEDAPTRIRAGSHLDIARQLAPAGELGRSLRELAINGFAESADRPEVLTTGAAGTVYLCHPFLVHAAQAHTGKVPRFLAQPPLLPRGPLQLERAEGDYSPVEQAIRLALTS